MIAYADVQIPAEANRDKAIQSIKNTAAGMWMQFGAIILEEPVIGPVESATGGGWEFVRIHFRIWPGQGNLIEITFRQQVIAAMKIHSPTYAEWQVPVTYRAMTAAKNAGQNLESNSVKPPG